MNITKIQLVTHDPKSGRYYPPCVEIDAESRGLKQEFSIHFNRKGMIEYGQRISPSYEYYKRAIGLPRSVLTAALQEFRNSK